MGSRKKILVIGLVIGLSLMSVPPSTVGATSLSSITSDSIKEKEGQIDQAQKDKENLQKTLTDIKKMKEELETKKSNLKEYVAQLDKNLNIVENNIATLKMQISMKEESINETQNELDKAMEVKQTQYDSMVQRIRLFYEKGDAYLVEVLLTAKSFSDLLNKADYVQSVYDYDRRMYEEFCQTADYIDLCRQQLELEREYLNEQREAVEQEQANLEDLIETKGKEIKRYESDIGNKEQAIREYEAEIAEQEEVISTLEAQVAEEKKRILANSGKVLTYDGGKFKFPLATYTRISDEYGMRIHPTLGVEQFHNGVDFAAPQGTAIYAAYDGVVVAATYSATMGNYIMLDHGDGLYTIYMHASALYVSKDDVVARGDTIAAVGSTGRSTGNHLHFTVRQNGSYVSPWNYLSQ